MRLRFGRHRVNTSRNACAAQGHPRVAVGPQCRKVQVRIAHLLTRRAAIPVQRLGAFYISPNSTWHWLTFAHRPDQLILGDDPAFVPEVMPELDMDFAMQDLSSSASSLRSSHASKGSHRSSLTSQGSQDGGFNIVIPSDASPSSGRDPVPRDRESRDRQSFGLDDDLGLLPDVGFEFDAEGNLIDTFLEDILSPGRRASEAESADRLPGGAGAAAPGAQDHANEVSAKPTPTSSLLLSSCFLSMISLPSAIYCSSSNVSSVEHATR